MEKITDFKYILKYFCTKHNCFHRRYRTEVICGEKRQIPTDSFILCQEFAVKLTESELYNWKFKKSWKRYTIKKHKESVNSKCQ